VRTECSQHDRKVFTCQPYRLQNSKNLTVALPIASALGGLPNVTVHSLARYAPALVRGTMVVVLARGVLIGARPCGALFYSLLLGFEQLLDMSHRLLRRNLLFRFLARYRQR
jgi:hypothetical protein